LYDANLFFFQLDSLVAQEDELLNIWHGEWIPLVGTPPRNCSFDELSEENAKSLTRFNKDQLNQLLLHWQIPAVIFTGSQRHCFSGEEVLIVSLAKLATGDPWTCLIPDFLAVMCGAGLQRLDGLSIIYLSNFITKFLENECGWVKWKTLNR
jgi:hypothetical protein